MLIVLTLGGMVMDVRQEQPENAQSPIAVTLSGMVVEVRQEQPENVFSPIAVTLSGMVIEVRLLQEMYLLLVDYQCYTL